jgi:polysaccharide biosynthesis/export protein
VQNFMNVLRVAVIGLLPCLLAACGGAGTFQEPISSHAGEATGDLSRVAVLPPPLNSAGGLEQSLLPGDVLTIEIFQASDLNRTVQVDARGLISLPLIGTLTAGGKTLRGLEAEIKRLYGARYIQNPQVSVFLKDSVGQRVTVDGEVAKPGLFPVSYNTSLLDALALAGGFRDLADPRKVYVYRTVGERKLVANYNVADIRDGRMSNPQIYGGDVVVVFTSRSRVAINNLKEALGLSARAATGISVLP